MTGKDLTKSYLQYRKKSTRVLKSEDQGPLRRGAFTKLSQHSRRLIQKSRPPQIQPEGMSGRELLQFLTVSLRAGVTQGGERRILIRGLRNHPSMEAVRKDISMYGELATMRILYVARSEAQCARDKARYTPSLPTEENIEIALRNFMEEWSICWMYGFNGEREWVS